MRAAAGLASASGNSEMRLKCARQVHYAKEIGREAPAGTVGTGGLVLGVQSSGSTPWLTGEAEG